MSKQSPDRRKYCNEVTASTPIPFLFGCFQHYLTSSNNVRLLRNTTVVPNYANPATPATIPPYERVVERITNCAAYDNYVCGNGINGNLYCDAPPTESITSSEETSSAFAVGKYLNYYVETDESASFAQCKEYGFKNVVASKIFQGRIPYNSGYWGAKDTFNEDCSCSYRQFDTESAIHTQYLTMVVSASWSEDWEFTTYPYSGESEDCCDGFESCTVDATTIDQYSYSASMEQVISVDRYSGNLTTTCTSQSASPDCFNVDGFTFDDGDPCPTMTSYVASVDCSQGSSSALKAAIDAEQLAIVSSLMGLANTNNSYIYGLFCASKLPLLRTKCQEVLPMVVR
jgi:hypothetical protein